MLHNLPLSRARMRAHSACLSLKKHLSVTMIIEVSLRINGLVKWMRRALPTLCLHFAYTFSTLLKLNLEVGRVFPAWGDN